MSFCFELIERLDVEPAVGNAGEHFFLDFFELDFEPVQHGKVAVDDRVHERIQDETRALLEQLGLALAAFAHVLEPLFGAAANRQHIVAADEDIDLADLQFVVDDFDRMQHGEQRIPIFLDLGTLVAMLRIFHRQFVQAEFPLHLGEFFGSGLVQRDPDKTFRPADILADIFFTISASFLPSSYATQLISMSVSCLLPDQNSSGVAGFGASWCFNIPRRAVRRTVFGCGYRPCYSGALSMAATAILYVSDKE
jgi:hypothetical protein